jgi:CTP-dependent riboflavin kinase
MISFYEHKGITIETFNPTIIVDSCIENGFSKILIDRESVPRQFFDLSNGLTGGLVHRLTVYGIKMAVVIPDKTVYSQSFQDFVREANKGKQFRFTLTREDAIAWLDGD